VDISIFIPVYKDSNELTSTLKKLNSQNVSKEIFVTVDMPTKDFSEKIKNLAIDNVRFTVNNERIGKANALNNTAKFSSGKVLLFLDSDVEVKDDPDY